jgi:endogenous inhibitor of DNA gyrase (YacG/DUF329 family)
MSRLCPQCRKPTEEKYRPFCSKRCADLDLGHWLNGTYAIPVHEDDGSIPDADESVDTDHPIR